MTICRIILGAAIALACGCVSAPRGASARVNDDEAREALRGMRRMPRATVRPVVILNGFRSPAFAAASLKREIIRTTDGDGSDVALVAYPFVGDIDRCARRAVEQVCSRWPAANGDETIEVDVVGLSMGGLVARWAALTPSQRSEILVRCGEPAGEAYPRLRMARLFTFATPHRGSDLAHWGFCSATRDMQPGSAFLASLDEEPLTYDTISYAHEGDRMVAVDRAAPTGQSPIWNEGTLLMSHYTTHEDPVLVADLLRRLRGEDPLLPDALPDPE